MELLKIWEKTRKLPGGKLIFSKILGRVVPYTGTLGAIVLQLEPGFSRVELKDRRGVRNHLQSIHAVALMNLGEVSSGLALVSSIPANARAILVHFEIDFKKKARGTLTAETRCPVHTQVQDMEVLVGCPIRDQAGDVVAEIKARWKVGPPK